MRTKTLHPKVYERLLKQIPVPERFNGSTLANFDVADEYQSSVIEAVKVYADTFADRLDSGASLILYGTPGAGKTHLAFGIAKEIARRGFSSRYVTAAQLARLARHELFSAGAWCANGFDAFTGADLLIIDNVDWPADVDLHSTALQSVLMERYSQCLPSILITSLGRGAFTDLLGIQSMDRLAANGTKLLVLDWASHRQPHKAQLEDEGGAES